MTKKLYKSLKNAIKENLYLYEIEDFSRQVDDFFAQSKLSQLEYDELAKIIKQQLKFILDLNLLPCYELISNNLQAQETELLVKVDPGEIIKAEFEIIEQEAINLNLARVKFIQENFCNNYPQRRNFSQKQKPNKVNNKIWQKLVRKLFKVN